MPQTKKPKWEELSPGQRRNFGNGLGPENVPLWAKSAVTKIFNSVYGENAWRKHDFYYTAGHERSDRADADQEFHDDLRAAISGGLIVGIPLLALIQPILVLLVTYGGRRHFHKADQYRTIREILAVDAMAKSGGRKKRGHSSMRRR